MGRIAPIRVLIVDSHANVPEGLTIFFEIVENMTLVAEAASGPEAPHLCHLFQPDVILMDVKVTGLDVIALVRLIRQLNNQSQIILLVSGEGNNHLIQAALDAGATLSLQKDVSGAVLIHAIETAYASRPVSEQREDDPRGQGI